MTCSRALYFLSALSLTWGCSHPPASRAPSQAERVLVIGDSHTAQSYGIMLHGLLWSEGVEVETYGRCGSAPRGWMSEGKASTKCGYFDGQPNARGDRGTNKEVPHLPDLLKDKTYDLVVVGLGANQLNMGEGDEAFKREKDSVLDIVSQIKSSGARCLWVGPTDGWPQHKPVEKQNRLYRMLREAHEESGKYCQFLPSRTADMPFMTYPAACAKDGAHWDACTEGRIRAVGWAHQVFKASMNLLRH